ncbi:hypothetical protein [Acinetobacter haemolyticus]|uniref:hypothetical protein n=1 Tax=Acinetobacter haemolyticus TaxID=29430 RepID=UPI001D1949D3|nr:hypothetical protein [Acinetobacter haemolyticus]
MKKTIEFRDKDGNEFSGEIFIKIVNHDSVVSASDIWKIENKHELTLDQLRKALLFQVVYSDPDTKFFAEIDQTGTLTTEVLDAMYKAADGVLDFAGKQWISVQKKNSGVSLQPVESVDTPSQTQEET